MFAYGVMEVQKAKLDGTVTAKKKAAHGLDCNPERNSAVVCP